MSLSGTTFRWLDILEAEFDRTFVEVDQILIIPDTELEYVVGPVRERMAKLCAIFAQLTDKTQTIFQTNAKLEAQLCNVRRDLIEAQAQKSVIEQEHRKLLFEYHRSQVENARERGQGGPEETEAESILHRLTNGKGSLSAVSLDEARLGAEVNQLRKENVQLREWLVDLQSDLFGANLATKYLDKELAGRIQQIQLLSRDPKGKENLKLWDHLESEINLQRHKTIIQACRSRAKTKPRLKQESQQIVDEEYTTETSSAAVNGHSPQDASAASGVLRQVEIYKEPGKGLGLVITGGFEHGVPVLISDVKEGQLAAVSGKFFVGDAILSVNGVDLRRAKHSEAVQILSQLEGNIHFELLYLQPESDEDSVGSFSFPVEKNGSSDSLRPLNRSVSQNSEAEAGSCLSIRRRSRFPGYAVNIASQPNQLDQVETSP
ncbi:hypothetical protein RvY_11183-2 [Ramazzottius varieornatus]|uniref:PDZ domain-containing protein n=1 Tax=Ramazzottius varieornatus TaxID=947166 RepID=A0A1D1VHP7_RAMVA|nr:hypothetical protein RvY_11183-2 [Ramazzottius varieornatus]